MGPTVTPNTTHRCIILGYSPELDKNPFMKTCLLDLFNMKNLVGIRRLYISWIVFTVLEGVIYATGGEDLLSVLANCKPYEQQ